MGWITPPSRSTEPQHLSYFFIVRSDQWNVNREGFILVHSLSVQSTVEGAYCSWSHRVCRHKADRANLGAQLVFSCLLGMWDCATCVGLLTSVKPLWQRHHRHAQRYSSYVILGPARLAILTTTHRLCECAVFGTRFCEGGQVQTRPKQNLMCPYKQGGEGGGHWTQRWACAWEKTLWTWKQEPEEDLQAKALSANL